MGDHELFHQRLVRGGPFAYHAARAGLWVLAAVYSNGPGRPFIVRPHTDHVYDYALVDSMNELLDACNHVVHPTALGRILTTRPVTDEPDRDFRLFARRRLHPAAVFQMHAVVCTLCGATLLFRGHAAAAPPTTQMPAPIMLPQCAGRHDRRFEHGSAFGGRGVYFVRRGRWPWRVGAPDTLFEACMRVYWATAIEQGRVPAAMRAVDALLPPRSAARVRAWGLR